MHALLIDYSNAFDRVNQEKAAEQFNEFIESPHLKKWLYEFSTGRQQRLIWKGKPLTYQLIDRGCSQGTVGGPALFSMFTDDCRVANPTSRLFKYSDDMNCISLCRKDPSNNEKNILNEEINSILKYAKSKELDINIKKSKHMRFCLNRRPFCQCEYHGTFETVDEAKILGITFQSDTSFRKHCHRLVSHLRRLLYILKDLKINGIPTDNVNMIFESLILSRVRYGLSVYGADDILLRKIDRFLERCHEKNYCTRRITASGLRSEEDRRNKQRILNDPSHPLFHYLTSFTKTRTTRHGFLSTRPHVRTKAFHQVFSNRVLSLS